MENKRWIGSCALFLFGIVIGVIYKNITGKKYILHLPELEKLVNSISI